MHIILTCLRHPLVEQRQSVCISIGLQTYSDDPPPADETLLCIDVTRNTYNETCYTTHVLLDALHCMFTVVITSDHLAKTRAITVDK